MSTLAVVEIILRETGEPMSARQIVTRADGRLPTRSRTPDTVVARDLSMDIKKRGAQSRFVRTEPGRYTLRSLLEAKQAEQEASEATPMVAAAIRSERAGTLPARSSDERDARNQAQ